MPIEEIDDSRLFTPVIEDPSEEFDLHPGEAIGTDPKTGKPAVVNINTEKTVKLIDFSPEFNIGDTDYMVDFDDITKIYDQLDITDIEGTTLPEMPSFNMTYSESDGYTITDTDSASSIDAGNIKANHVSDITIVTDSAGNAVAVSLTSNTDNNTITVNDMQFVLNTGESLDLYIDDDGKIFAQVEGDSAIIDDNYLEAGCITLSPGTKYRYTGQNNPNATATSTQFDPFALYNPSTAPDDFFLCIRTLTSQNFDYSCEQCGNIDTIEYDGYLRGTLEYEKLSTVGIFTDAISAKPISANLAFDPFMQTLSLVHPHKTTDAADFSSGPFVMKYDHGIYKFRFGDYTTQYSIIQIFPMISIYAETMNARNTENNIYYYAKNSRAAGLFEDKMVAYHDKHSYSAVQDGFEEMDLFEVYNALNG